MERNRGGGGEICRKNIRIVEEEYGKVLSSENAADEDDDAASTKIKSYKMSNDYGMEVVVITWGATIVSIKCLDKYGDAADVVLGFDDLNSYLDPRLSQMMGGCIVGRCCNKYSTTAAAAANDFDGLNSCSFGRRVWEAYIEDDCRVVMSYTSPDGEDGYPGALLATIKFELTRYNSLEIGMRVVSSKPTTVNLSHSSIFNLAGHATGPTELRAHEISLNCDRWIQQQQQPTGVLDGVATDAAAAVVIRRVGGTIMDLRMPQPFGQVIDKFSDKGLYHYFGIITRYATSLQQPKMSFVSRISHPKSGRFLEIYSDQPGVDFYTGGQLMIDDDHSQASTAANEKEEHERNRQQQQTGSSNSSTSSKQCLNIADCECKSQSSLNQIDAMRMTPLEFLPGKCGAKYRRFGGFSLLPRNYHQLPTTAAIQSLFPSATLRPGQVYYHDLIYKFGVELDGNYCAV